MHDFGVGPGGGKQPLKLPGPAIARVRQPRAIAVAVAKYEDLQS